jgi:hypothetical protein
MGRLHFFDLKDDGIFGAGPLRSLETQISDGIQRVGEEIHTVNQVSLSSTQMGNCNAGSET